MILGYQQEEKIAELLKWRTIKKVSDDTLELDNGTKLRVVPNDGGCSCGAGDYRLDELNEVPNAITAVEFNITDEEPELYYGEKKTYRIFVLAENQKSKLLEVSGNDGSGYYGTGYWIEVEPITM